MHKFAEPYVVENDFPLDVPFLLTTAVKAAQQEKAMNTDLYRDVMDFKLNPTDKILLVKHTLMDRTISLAADGSGKGILSQNAKIHFMQAFLSYLLGAEYAILLSPEKLSHPILSLIPPMATIGSFGRIVNNVDDAGLRDVRALSDWTMLGCIHGGTTIVPQQHEIRIFDSACILQRISDEGKDALRSHLYVFSRRNTSVEFAEILQPLLYEDDVEGPILVNILDGVMTFVAGSPNRDMAWRGISYLHDAIDNVQAANLGHTIDFETGDILILKKQAVLYCEKCLDDPMPLVMGGTDRELSLSYWLTASTVAE